MAKLEALLRLLGLLGLLLMRRLGYVLALAGRCLAAPVAIKVARVGAGMAATTAAALELVRTGQRFCREVSHGATHATASTTDSHALATAMPTAAASTGRRRRGGVALAVDHDVAGLSLIGGRVRGCSRGAGGRKLEARGGAFLLGNFGGLARVGDNERMAALVSATGASTTPAAARARTATFSGMGWALKIAKGRPRCTRRRGRRGAHAHARESRLITAM